jgi:hypothetical protein
MRGELAAFVDTSVISQKARIKLPAAQALEYVRSLTEWHVVDVVSDLVLSALVLADRMRISPWDAAILEAARKAGCGLVLSEDLGAPPVLLRRPSREPLLKQRGSRNAWQFLRRGRYSQRGPNVTVVSAQGWPT